MSAIASGNSEAARAQIQAFKEQLEDYDAMDRAEILAAGCWLETRLPGVKLPAKLRAEWHRLGEKLRVLPPAVSDQLARLGVLESQN
jgi:hypothetical protein